MPLLSRAAFARLAKVSKPAISKAIARGRLELTSMGRIDTDSKVARAYLAHETIHQRRDHLARKRRQATAAERGPTEQDLLAAWAARGRLPDGWGVIALADVLGDNGRPLPLLFTGPSGKPAEEIRTILVRDGSYRLDLDRNIPIAIDRQGQEHPLHLEVFGSPWWCPASEETPARGQQQPGIAGPVVSQAAQEAAL